MSADESRSPSLWQLLRDSMEARLVDVHTSIAGRVVSYNGGTGTEAPTASIEVCVRSRRHDDDEVQTALPQLDDVPVFYPRGAGFFMGWPLAVGDFGLLVFGERATDTWLAGDGAPGDALDLRKHGLTDAVFLPGWGPSSSAIPALVADALVIGRETGTTGQVRIKNDNTIEVEADAVTVISPDVKLGSGGATDPVALSSLVEGALSTIKGAWAAAKVAASLPGAPDRGVAGFTAGDTAVAGLPGSVKATKVKAE